MRLLCAADEACTKFVEWNLMPTVCVLKVSDNSASKNDVANDGRDDDDEDPQSFSETY